MGKISNLFFLLILILLDSSAKAQGLESPEDFTLFKKEPRILKTVKVTPVSARPGPWYKDSELKVLRITLQSFDKTFSQKRVQDDLDKVNEIFGQCGIQLAPQINVQIFESTQDQDLSYAGSLFGEPNPKDARWGKLQRHYMKEGIPVFLLSYNDEGMGFGANLKNKGVAIQTNSSKTNTVNFKYKDELVKKRVTSTFPPYSIYLSDYEIPEIATINKRKDSVITLSHELGHILFQEGHNNKKHNLMYDFRSYPKNSVAQKISKEQCNKARSFINHYRDSVERPERILPIQESNAHLKH